MTLNRKPLITLIVLIIIAIGCVVYNLPKHTSGHKPVKRTQKFIDVTIVLQFTDTTDDGRPMYSVMLPDNKVLDAMYPEEIAQSLIEGEWHYNEDLRIR